MSEANERRTPIAIDIAVCTFRRHALRQTLLSLGVMKVPQEAEVRIIVADNDTVPSARSLVDSIREALPFPVEYVHCPARNISLARNACLDAASGDYLAFIDDDEMASENWLSALVETARATRADAVLGPVRSVYTPGAPAWMRRGDFHSTLPVWVDGEIRTGYTCNVLLRRTAPCLEGRRFNLALGLTGGEDTEFFDHMFRAGGRLAYAPEALVYEPVPENRAALSWLAKRRFRFGQTHGRLLAERGAGRGRVRHGALAGAKAGFCGLAAGLWLFSPVKRYRYGLRAVMHAGVVSGLMGISEIEQYAAAEPTA